MFGYSQRIGNLVATESIFSTVTSGNQLGEKPADIAFYIPGKNSTKLLFGKFAGEEEQNAIFKRNFIVFHNKIEDAWMEFNYSTKEIEFHNTSPEFLQDKKFDKVSWENILSFEMDVVREKNMFVYGLFTEPTAQSIRIWNNDIIINNIMRMIMNIDLFEKVVKVSGENFLFTNLVKPDFQLSDSKKLKKALGIPEEVRKFIKTNRLENHFSQFQKLSENPNDAIDLITYIKSMKKFFGTGKYQIERFLDALSELNDVSDLPLRQLMGHLIRENYFFGTAACPVNEAAEWKDCLTMAKAANISLDKCPQNIVKYHRILAKNVDVLNHPRKEEFETAVSLYSRLTKEMEDSGYVIRPPKNEKELVQEGNVLHHCVASYRDKIIDEHAIVLFCRKMTEPNIPLYTIELDYKPGDTSFTVVQFKKIYDADVTEPELLKMLNKYLDSRRYIIENGSNLFRKPRTFKAKKDEDKATAVEEEGE